MNCLFDNQFFVWCQNCRSYSSVGDGYLYIFHYSLTYCHSCGHWLVRYLWQPVFSRIYGTAACCGLVGGDVCCSSSFSGVGGDDCCCSSFPGVS